MINWNEIRDEFPVCKKYAYLNPAGGSPMSRSASEAGQQFYKEMLEHGDTYWEIWLERAEKVRKDLADFIGAGRDEIGFTTNTSHGMNIVALFLKDKGKVLTMRDEFPSTTYPWLNQGTDVLFAEPTNHRYSIDGIKKHLTPEVKILVTSYVQYSTGFRQDLKALGQFCKDNDLIFVVNATQALGIFPVDVKECQIDFLVFTGLKWATAGYGIGGLYVDRKWLHAENFPLAGWRSAVVPEKMDNATLELKNEASVIESGCPHFPNIFALGGALEMFNRIGSQNVVDRVITLNRLLEDELKKLGMEVIAQPEDKHRSGILIAKIPNPKKVVQQLSKRKIIVSARGEGVRISNSIFNNEEDIQILIETLKVLL